MNWLELKVPPPVVAALAGAAMWLAAPADGAGSPAGDWRTAMAVALALPGMALEVAGLYAFRRAHTTVNPLRPAGTSALVTGGVYRITRNPMYLGLAVMLLAWAMYLGAPLALAGVAAFMGYITRWQILPEERALARKFGTEFAAYAGKVRRWL
ncbi:methyltransferase family protein [Diaphorobacter sp.]